MRTMPLLAAAALALPAVLVAQPRLASVGVSFGATSDFGRGLTPLPDAPPRQFSLGIPVHIHLAGDGPVSVGALGVVEWSHAPADVRGDGLSQMAVGPEVRARRRALDLRLAGLFGVIQRRGDDVDSRTHQQYGVEAGAGLARSTWRVGYSYRRAWVRNVPHAYPPCPPADICRYPLSVEPPTTEKYDRHAISFSWQR